MKITLDWLRRHLETDATLDDVVSTLNRIGIEVEAVVDPGRAFTSFTVGQVRTATQHPNADRLQVLIVDTCDGDVQVICGAPNARKDLKGVFAPAGTYIPGTGLDLKKSEIRGVVSCGMLCSEREMGISDEHDGIIELPDDAPVGAPYATVAGLDDPVIDLKVTPDRGDCFGVRGIARDLAAAGLGKLIPIQTHAVEGSFKSPVDIVLDFDDATRDACPAFLGRYFRGLKNGPSPDWMQRKLEAVGLRPISALVDITNWLTMDIGRPAHIYDADKLTGNIGSRIGRKGESFEALNGRCYDVTPEMTVINDESGVLGLGGIIGGEHTGVQMDTTNGFIEIALFDKIRTARTGRTLELVTDARQRFERGIDDAAAAEGLEIATRLVVQICGGEASAPVIAGAIPTAGPQLTIRPSRVRTLGGADVSPERATDILRNLGFKVDVVSADSWHVRVPTWRHDMQCEADVIEEILRIHGFDNIPMVSLPRNNAVTRPVLTRKQRNLRTARRVLSARGMNESVTYSFVSSSNASRFGGGAADLTLVNPISADMDVMRPSGLPGLLHAGGKNVARGEADFGLFEIGPVYRQATPEGQQTSVAGIRAGNAVRRHWGSQARPADLFDAKSDALAVLESIGIPVARLQTSRNVAPWFHPGRTGTLQLGPKQCAVFGELHPQLVADHDMTGSVAAFEIILDDLPVMGGKGPARSRLKLSSLQPVRRDFAFVVSHDVTSETLIRAIRSADKELIGDVEVFDLYSGDQVESGMKSVAVSVNLEPVVRTLTDAELDAVATEIVSRVAKRTNGRLRGD